MTNITTRYLSIPVSHYRRYLCVSLFVSVSAYSHLFGPEREMVIGSHSDAAVVILTGCCLTLSYFVWSGLGSFRVWGSEWVSGFVLGLGFGGGKLGARGSCRAWDWEALGSCLFGAHGVCGFGIVLGSGFRVGLGVRVGLDVTFGASGLGARDWEALGSCWFGAHGVWGFGLVVGSWLGVGLGVLAFFCLLFIFSCCASNRYRFSLLCASSFWGSLLSLSSLFCRVYVVVRCICHAPFC
jgi:hypothetical protein